MKLKSRKVNEGFTLIEIIIALSIIAIVFTGFFGIINSSIKHNVKTEKNIKVLNIAQDEIENIRSQIKSNTIGADSINIYDGQGNVIISIQEDTNISWEEQTIGSEIIEKIKINPSGIYSSYIEPGSENSVLKYNKTLEDDLTQYNVKLKIERKSMGSKKMYMVDVNVSTANNNFANKEINLNTNILSK